MVSTVTGMEKTESGLNDSLVSLTAMRKRLRYNRILLIARLPESPSRSKRAAIWVRKSLWKEW